MTIFSKNFWGAWPRWPSLATPMIQRLQNFTPNSEKILLDLAANQLKWQHCWPQS